MLGLLALLFGVAAVGAVTVASGTDNGSSGSDDGGSQSTKTLAATAEETYGVEDAASTFYAADGQLVLEAESGEASGSWSQVRVEGEKAMLWDAEGNSYGQAREGEEIAFDFVTEEAGTYKIALHAGRFQSAQDPGDVRDDTGNDAWVKITNIETGEVLVEPTKLFTSLGEADRELKWGKTFDKNHEKSDAQVTLEADTAYRLELIGRSDGHVIDRITLSNDGFLRDTEVEESGTLLDALATMESANFETALPEDDFEEAEIALL